MPSHRHSAGFTLIELMVVLVVLGVLASIAYPNYQEYVRRGHRAQARGDLMKIAQWMERAATANGTYPITTVAAQKTAIDGLIASVPNSAYTYQITSTSGAAFTVQAVPQHNQTKDPCGTLLLDHTGAQTVQNASRSAAECWSK